MMLDVKPLIKEEQGNCVAYSVKSVINSLSLNEIIDCMGGVKFNKIDDLFKLESLGLKVRLYNPKESVIKELLDAGNSLVYFDCKKWHAGVITGYNRRNFYIHDLKNYKKIRQSKFACNLDCVALINE